MTNFIGILKKISSAKNGLRSLLAVLLMTCGVHNALALGVCTYPSTQPQITLNMDLTSQQDWSNGLVIGEVVFSQPYKVAENCSGDYQMTKSPNTSVYPASTSTIFKSGVEGVGLRITIGNTTLSAGTNQTSATGDGSTPINLQDIDVEIIKTGKIVPGALTPGKLASVEIKDSKGAKQVLTVNIGSINIKEAACEITGSSTIPVSMGKVNKTDFTGKNSALTPVNVQIPLQCNAGSRVNVLFDAKSSLGNGIIDLTAGGAEGVGIQLKLNNTPVVFNNTLFVATAGEQGAFNIPLTAAYIQTTDTIKPGTANAVANFTVTYE
jgi:type 1 fimbria pilin